MATPTQTVRRLRHSASKHGLRTITVRVGQQTKGEDFTVHEDLIRARSPFFDAAMRNDWAEAGERVIRLPDDDAASFMTYHHWIYSRTIYSKFETADEEATYREWVLLIDSYILGEKLQDPDFKDAVIDAILEKTETENSGPTGFTAKLYNGTPKGSLARQLLVDMHVWKGWDKWITEERRHCYTFDSLLDIAAALLKEGVKRSSPETPPYVKNRCLYHEHTRSGTPCYKTKG